MSTHDPTPAARSQGAEAPPTWVRHQLSLWLAVAATTAYLCRNCLVVAEKSIRLELNLSEEQMGFLLGPAFFWSYALIQIPGGWLGEKFGSRLILPIYSVVWSPGNRMLGNRQRILVASRGTNWRWNRTGRIIPLFRDNDFSLVSPDRTRDRKRGPGCGDAGGRPHRGLLDRNSLAAF